MFEGSDLFLFCGNISLDMLIIYMIYVYTLSILDPGPPQYRLQGLDVKN